MGQPAFANVRNCACTFDITIADAMPLPDTSRHEQPAAPVRAGDEIDAISAEFPGGVGTRRPCRVRGGIRLEGINARWMRWAARRSRCSSFRRATSPPNRPVERDGHRATS